MPTCSPQTIRSTGIETSMARRTPSLTGTYRDWTRRAESIVMAESMLSTSAPRTKVCNEKLVGGSHNGRTRQFLLSTTSRTLASPSQRAWHIPRSWPGKLGVVVKHPHGTDSIWQPSRVSQSLANLSPQFRPAAGLPSHGRRVSERPIASAVKDH